MKYYYILILLKYYLYKLKNKNIIYIKYKKYLIFSIYF
jgi:hypothetical protein